jgi:hypothetical protein
MVPMLLGEHSAAHVEADLGPCPSGTEALAFYAVLARRDLASVLRQMFVATRVVARRLRGTLWEELAEGYMRDHRSTHWEPNRFAAAFSDFIARRRADGLEVPPFLEELADFEYARFVVTISEPREVLIRQYEYDIRAIARDPASPLPAPRTTVVAIYRDGRSRSSVCELGMAEMAVLAASGGRPVALSLEPAAVQAAAQRLRALGVL